MTPGQAQGRQQEPRITAFVNVNVIPMDEERVLRNYTVVVEHGRVMEMGPAGSVTVPANAQRIEGSGKYLMPGLAEMHGHTPSGLFAETVMFLYVANGVTTVRGMLGLDGHLELRRRASTGQIIAPTLYLAGPSFNNRTVSSVQHAIDRVRLQKREGWDHLKIHPGLTVEQYDAVARTASAVGMRFGGHVPADVGIVHAIKMGQLTFDHLDGYLEYTGGIGTPIDDAKLDEVIELTKQAGAAVVPTMVLWEVGIIGLGEVDEMVNYPEMRYWPQQGVNQWARSVRSRRANPDFDVETARAFAENRRRLLKKLNDAGVTILMGTDSPQMFSVPGFSLHREMQAMSNAGMTTYEILESGTKNVGEYFRNNDAFGTIGVGRRADFILTNSNPLDDVANVADRAGVMVRGRWLSEEMIQQRLAEIARELGS
jgi:imidazolonepropionase-like amidohydrolase